MMKKYQRIKLVSKTIAFAIFVALNFTACSSVSIGFNQPALIMFEDEQSDQISTKAMFKDKKGFKPINMDIKLKNLKNAKEVK